MYLHDRRQSQKRGSGLLSVALFHIFADEISEPENVPGGDTVYLSELMPYGIAAFEVTP